MTNREYRIAHEAGAYRVYWSSDGLSGWKPVADGLFWTLESARAYITSAQNRFAA